MAKNADELQKDREELIRKLMQVLDKRGYSDIRASRLEEFAGNRPVIIYWENSDEGFMPDIMARKNRTDYLFQVETADTLRSQIAGRQIALFSAYARHYRKQFCLAVPQPCRAEAREIMRRLQVDEQFTYLLELL